MAVSSSPPFPATYWLLAVPTAIGAGAFVAVAPLAAVAVATTVTGALALQYSVVRLLVISVGGVLILQGSQGFNAPKLAYFGLILVSWVISILRLMVGRTDQKWTAPFKRLFIGSLMVLGLLIVSAPVALDNGVPLVAWARDATPYALLALLPLIGVDCARDVSFRIMLLLFSAVGTVAILGFAVDWLGRRGVSDLGLTKFSLSSFALIAAIFSFAIVRAARGPARWHWFALAAFALIAVLVSGARTGLVLLAGFVGIAAGSRRIRVPIRATLGVLAALTLLAVVLTPYVASLASSNPAFLSQRFEAALSFLHSGNDPSYSERAVQYAEAATEIRTYPLLGTGPGFLYPAIAPGGSPTFTLDTPLVTPAKLGLLGTAIVAFWLIQVGSTVRASRRLIGATQVGAALRAFALIFVFDLPFGGFVEDKGFSIALMLFLGLLAASTRERLTETSGDRDSSAVDDRGARLFVSRPRRRTHLNRANSLSPRIKRGTPAK